MEEKINILIVEDDSDINDLLAEILVNKGYNIRQVYSGTEALMCLEQEKYHLIILDLMLPGKTGEEVLKHIRKDKKMPILIISAKEELGIRAKLLRAGADDFIDKPFEIDEVLARIECNLRRYIEYSNDIKNVESIKYKEFLIDKETRKVFINEKEIILTSREFAILELFVTYPTKVFSKSNLYKSVWKEEYLGDDNTITVHISNLRNKIIKSGINKDYIKTIWGIGYRMEA